MAKFSLTSLKAFVSGFADQPFWIGIDVHKLSYYIALRRADGRSLTWGKLPARADFSSD